MKATLSNICLVTVLLAQPFLFAQSTIVSATKVLDNTGALLSSGQLCVGSTCFLVTNGAITSTAIGSTTADVTVTNGGSTTYLTLPDVSVSGSYWSFDNYVVPGSTSIAGIGTPRIACQPGAVYTQTDGDQNKWVCVDINDVGTWNGVMPAPSGNVGGTVTSVYITWPSIFCVSGANPITSAGTMVASLCNEPANTVLAGPPSGSATVPGFRPLTVADLPFTYSGNTTKLATVSGSTTPGVALAYDANGNIVASGAGTVFSGTITASQVTGLAASATIDTTNASNITSGTLADARLSSTPFTCPNGQAMTAFTLSAGTPNCIGFQGVVASGAQYELPMYSIAGYGTTLSYSQITTDANGDLTLPGTLTAANLTLTGSVAQNQFLASPSGAAGAPGFRDMTTADLPAAVYGTQSANSVFAGPASGSSAAPGFRALTTADLPSTIQNLVASQSAAAVYAAPTGSAGVPTFRSLAVGDLPSSLQGTVASQAGNLVYSSPNGSAGTPAFRAIATADLPFTYSGNTTKLATASGSYTSGDGVQIDANGNLVDSGHSSAAGTVLASVEFTTCALVTYGGTDHNCTGSQNWGSTLPNSSYKMNCTIGNVGFSGGTDTTGLTQTFIQWISKSTTGFTYVISNIHDGSSGATMTADCAAIQ
jgi:hypothetical protein